MTKHNISKERFLALMEKLRNEKQDNNHEQRTEVQKAATCVLNEMEINERENSKEFNEYDTFTTLDKYGNIIEYNHKQKQAISLALKEESFILIGPAGTGKTTAMRGVSTELIRSGKAGVLDAKGHKYLSSNTPGIVICAFTKVAVNNIRRNVPLDLQNNCVTIHKLLEFEPEYYDVQDPETKEWKKKMVFEPKRNAYFPLPSSIKWIFIEESSMLGLDLWKQLLAACPPGVKFIFIGDIQQLPPVFGPAILGFKLLELSVIELTDVYRQALESPIIRLAHRILSGVPIPIDEIKEFKVENQLSISVFSKKVSDEDALFGMIDFFRKAFDKQVYQPAVDMILIPYNKAFGTIELNKGIANHLARRADSVVYQVIAGFNKLYFRVGEQVLYDKEAAIITKIEENIGYTGVQPLPPSKTLDYWGHDSKPRNANTNGGDLSNEDIDNILSQMAAGGSSEERVKKSSHKITVMLSNSEKEIEISSAGEINALMLGYALTVHKAQGSEWRKVFFILHQSHAKMVQREMLYTGVTRAREELYIICEPESFKNGVKSQRVKGNTIAEKAEFFKGKIKEGVNPDLEDE